jgi:hypothetical protein
MHSNSIRNIPTKKVIFILVIFLITSISHGQTSTYNQFWSEIQFNRTINEKWSLELNLDNTYSSTESSSQIFHTNTQKAFRTWGHYYLSPRWKLSSFLAYYDNKDVPEIGQFKSPEWRFALQGTYYFHKIGYTLSTRMRIELRYIRDENGKYQDIYRYRQQIKYLKPINSKVLREGVIYAIASDEIFFKSDAKITGLSFFDRNRLNLGAGYLFTDDIQIELTYANEYLPRDTETQVINAASVTLTFNNIFKNKSKKTLQKSNQ